MTTPDQTLALTFVVPADRAMEFQRRAMELLDDMLDRGDDEHVAGDFTLLPPAEARKLDQWQAPRWTLEDAASGLLEWTIRDMHPRARHTVAYLARHPDEIVVADDLVEALGLDSGKSLPPTIKAMCRSTRRAGRHPLYDFETHPQRGYRMPKSVATMVLALQIMDEQGNLHG